MVILMLKYLDEPNFPNTTTSGNVGTFAGGIIDRAFLV